MVTSALLRCGVEQWQLVGLITRRSQVQVLPPLLMMRPLLRSHFLFNFPSDFETFHTLRTNRPRIFANSREFVCRLRRLAKIRGRNLPVEWFLSSTESP